MNRRAHNSTLPARTKGLSPGKGFKPRTKGLVSRNGLERRRGLTVVVDIGARARLSRTGMLRPVSAKRAAENRERRRVIAGLFGEQPLCVVYEMSQQYPGMVPARVLETCGRWTDDIHEPLTRARGGSITDPENMTAPCRPCHDAIQRGPQWAYDLGLMRHSWDGGDAA